MTETFGLLLQTSIEALAKTRVILSSRWLLILLVALTCSGLSLVPPHRLDVNVFMVLGQIPIYFFLLADTCRFVRSDYKMTGGAVAGIVGWGFIGGILIAVAIAPIYIIAYVAHAQFLRDIAFQVLLVFAGARLVFVFLLAALGGNDNSITLSWRLSSGAMMLPLLAISVANTLLSFGISKFESSLRTPAAVFVDVLLSSILTALILAMTLEWWPISRERLAARELARPAGPTHV